MPWYAICPVCGFHYEHRYPKAKVQLPSNKKNIKKFITKVWPKHYSYRWIAALYIKTSL